MKFKENEKIELKKSTAQLREGIISLCGMLNKHNVGTVYFGIKDNGEVCGQQIGKNTTSDIAHEIRNRIKPLPDSSISVDTVDNKNIIEVSAKGDDTPYSAYGRYYTRVDDSDIEMDSKLLWKYFESKDLTYSKWEEKSSGKSIDYVDEELLIGYLREANDCGRLSYVYKNCKEALSKLNLISSSGCLNNAGYYLFGNDGPVLLKEVVYPTDDRRTFSDLKQFRGNIFQCITEASKYILNNIHFSAEIQGMKRADIPEIPIRAIREIVVNSFAHCKFQKGDSNEVSISKSVVRIYNPGGLIPNTEPIDFASGKVGSKIRNPLIATTLFKNGLIDAFGTGFDRAFKECDEHDVEYNYSSDDFGFTFCFLRSQNVQDIQQISLTEIDTSIISNLRINPFISIADLAKLTKVSNSTISRHLKSLSESGYIKRIGSKKSGHWNVIN